MSAFADFAPSSTALSYQQPSNYEVKAGFFSRLTFFWMYRLILKSYKRTITFADLDTLKEKNTSAMNVLQFENAWHSAKQNIKRKAYNMKTTANGRKEPGRRRYLLKAIRKSHGAYFLLAGLLKLSYDVASCMAPVLLKEILESIERIERNNSLVYAMALFGVCLIRTFFLQHYWHICTVVGMRIRTALSGSIYRKSLRLSISAKKQYSIGAMVTLASVDVYKLQEAIFFLHQTWSTPLSIGMILYLLYREMKEAVFVGFAVLLLLIPINLLLGAWIKSLQVSQVNEKENRLNLTKEVLLGIKSLKLFAWENYYEEKLLKYRSKELKYLKRIHGVSSIGDVSFVVAPILVCFVTFVVYLLLSEGHVLEPKNVFVTIVLFHLLNFPLASIPNTVLSISFARKAAVRIEDFLELDEVYSHTIVRDQYLGHALSLKNCFFSWTRKASPILKNINIQIKPLSLTAIIGNSRSGKSSLLSAIMGEMVIAQGEVKVKGSIAHVSQKPWIMNGTIKENILFFKDENPWKYEEILETCGLNAELKILPNKDKSVVGDEGVSLTVSLKQRISLARAVYQNANIYLLDDPLSAVPDSLAKYVFNHVLGQEGLLRNKTRVFVTNNSSLLTKTDQIIVMSGGLITESGTFDDINDYRFLMDKRDHGIVEEEHVSVDLAGMYHQTQDLPGSEVNFLTVTLTFISLRKNPPVIAPKQRHTVIAAIAKTLLLQQVEEELHEMETVNKVNKKPHNAYKSAFGSVATIVTYFGFLVGFIAAPIAWGIWLSMWTDDQKSEKYTKTVYLEVLGFICIALVVGVTTGAVGLACGSVTASWWMHRDLLVNLLSVPMSFYDVTPIGVILNLFSKDLDCVDTQIPWHKKMKVLAFCQTITIVAVIVYNKQMFLASAPFILFTGLFLQRLYVAIIKQLRQMDSATICPIYVHFVETISGMSSIRAYGEQHRFIRTADKLMDRNNSVFYPYVCSVRWLGIASGTLSSFVVLFAALFSIMYKDDEVSLGKMGLSLAYSLQATFAVNLLMRASSDLEALLVAVGKINKYKDIPTEENKDIVSAIVPPKNWPDKGMVEYIDFSTRYRSNLDLVLRHIGLEIESGKKVGLVGRTDSGKSSMIMSLFRILEATSGSIYIDKINIADLGVKDLRSRLTIVEADNYILSGTFRSNIDPYNKYDDKKIMAALEKVDLKDFVLQSKGGLDHEIEQNDCSLSGAQKHLMGLARALVHKSKILVLDEATASMDYDTAVFFHDIIKKEFKDSTVIIIAHKLNTILECDKIVAMSRGEIEEWGVPRQLLNNVNGLFYGLVEEFGLIV